MLGMYRYAFNMKNRWNDGKKKLRAYSMGPEGFSIRQRFYNSAISSVRITVGFIVRRRDIYLTHSDSNKSQKSI